VPSVSITWSNTSGIVGNSEIDNFSSSISGNNTCTFNGQTVYTWNFGDGQTIKGTNLTSTSHYYTGSKGQKFTVTLTITSSQNSSAPYSTSTVVTF
jgi:hypothetical protein